MLKNARNKGITLIALVISIIVLLILAGVTINAITGNESAMEKATEAREKNEQGAELEAIKLATVNAIASDLTGLVNADNLKEGLNGIVENEGISRINKDNSPWIVTGKTGMKYKIYQNGEVTSAEPVASVEFVNTADSIAVGKSKKLSIIAKGASGNTTEANEVTFTSGNTSLATVGDDGSIKIINDDSKIGQTVEISVIADGINSSNKCLITIIELIKPKIDENIILGNAIPGVNEETNADDWKILCNDELTGKIYAILDSYLPTSALPTGSKLSTRGDWAYYGAVSGDKAITRDEFVSELTDVEKWRNLVSNANLEIEVYGALPKGNPATEKTMDYAKSKRGGETYFVPSNASNLSIDVAAYWLASSSTGSTINVCNVYSSNGSANYDRYSYTNRGICPVAILPTNIVEQNENGIWEAK